jgi:hypothetical protein
VVSEVPKWPDALPQRVREAVRLVLADLQHPTPVALVRVTYEPDRDDAQFGVLTVWFADGTGGGFGVTVRDDQAEVIANVADHVQGLFHEQREAWGEPRPPCPGHPHPAVAEACDGTAFWVCPSDGRSIGRIGHVGAESA